MNYYSMALAALLALPFSIAPATADDTPKLKTTPHVAPAPPPPPIPPQPNCAPGYIPNNFGTCVPYNRPYRRPVIIQQTPAAEVEDTTPSATDWEGCRKTKLNQLSARRQGNADRANYLEEWLWKNCRSYSTELRDLEQDGM